MNFISSIGKEHRSRGGVVTPGVAFSNATGKWYVAITQQRKELYAVQHLENQGFCCFMPRFSKTRSHARKVETVVAPLFPGYVFVKFDLQRDRWRSINGTQGVLQLICADLAPISVAQDIIHGFLETCDERGHFRFGHGLKKGDRASLISGPFADIVGTVERLDSQGRVRLLLDMVFGRVKVTVAVDEVRSVPGSQTLRD